MPRWTENQTKAINEEGNNIIVSAGAGSGKTAVLTERVITKLKKGIKINELLILTFTNAAAGEMKERIRKAITKNEELADNLDLIENSYITTFDSFTLSLVQKYHYLLNLEKNFSIVDSSIIELKKEEILDSIFDQYYEKEDSLFNKLIDDFCTKNDNVIKKAILKIIHGIDLKSNKEDFLNSYIDNYLSDNNIDDYINKYLKLCLDLTSDIALNIDVIASSDFGDYADSLYASLDKLLKSKTYEELKESIDISLPRLPKDSEEIKPLKDTISSDLKILKGYLRFDSINDIKESFNISKDYIKVIIDIIKKFYKEVDTYKFNNNIFEFTDIEIMAINLLKKHEDIRSEVKEFYNEIMVDEYQDTNDLQEEFISLISKSNVYMVGDVKQSIYGFRNANPDIFKGKYDLYQNGKDGIKIDLIDNFRSRSEVVDAINYIFNLVMTSPIGGASYKEEHQMHFGNLSYEENKAKQNYTMENIRYNPEGVNFNKEEIEAFIIAKDIKDKIDSKYQVFDKDDSILRDATYKDFCIIMDRGTDFNTYKKIFEYLNLPLDIYQDKKLTSEVDIMVINNILGLVIKDYNKCYDQEFKYFFASVSRSFIIEYNDEEIFKYISYNTYKDSNLYNLVNELSLKVDTYSSYELLKEIINKFNIYEKLIKIGNVKESIIRIDNLLNIAKSLETLGYTSSDMYNYFKDSLDKGREITYKDGIEAKNAIKIMNIHKSKGLEFPICYFSGLYKKFNIEDIKDQFTFDNLYGIITPYFKEGTGTLILKDLLKDKFNISNISERIRLFYVALTRAKEKIIFVSPISDETLVKYGPKVPEEVKKHYNSFLSILNTIDLSKYTKDYDINKINLTKDYLINREVSLKLNKSSDIINYHENKIDNKLLEEKHASKIISKIIDKENKETLEYGTYMHEIFEQVDFLNVPDIKEKKQILNFVKTFNINSNTKVYKEHEFIYTLDNIEYHGIIDLILRENDDIKIIDYKLKNIDDDKYINQLNVYYNYLHELYPESDIKMYLYSIIDDKVKEVEHE